MSIERIISKFEKIQENIELIRSNLPSDFEEFSKMGLKKDGIYKRLEYSIELSMDIIAIINSDFKFGIPNGTPDLIQRLRKHQFISEKTADMLKSMKSFRNILVHIYGEIDDTIVYDILTERLDDFELIKDEILVKLRNFERK